MSDREQINAFYKDLDRLIDRYRHEFEMPYATAVGCLTMKATQLTVEVLEADDEPESP